LVGSSLVLKLHSRPRRFFGLFGNIGLLVLFARVLKGCSKATAVQADEIEFWGFSSSVEDFLLHL
jgi:hypothetical protein